MQMILTVDISGRNDLTQEGYARIVDQSSLRDCLETALGADVSIKVGISGYIDTVFLRGTNGDDDIFAAFPGCAAGPNPWNMIGSYSHIGQHADATRDYCNRCEEVTDPSEYRGLLAELECIGYDVRVIRKDRMNDADYTDARADAHGLG